MINLGDGPYRGKTERDIILSELRIAGITNITIEEKENKIIDPNCKAGQLQGMGIVIPSAEKRYLTKTMFKVYGLLEGWKFTRSWYYWNVSCEKKIDEIGASDAMVLHKTNGKKLRVAGHCGCPEPVAPWLKYHGRISFKLNSNGCVIFLDDNFLKFIRRCKNSNWILEYELLDKVYPGERIGMDHYHIDTQEALNALCGFLKYRGELRSKLHDEYIKVWVEDTSIKEEIKIDGYLEEKDENLHSNN